MSARLVDDAGELIMVSAKGMSTRFGADSLRPMGRATSGVIGMRFRGDDRLLAMDTVRPGSDLVTVTDGGFAKRTAVTGWNTKGRGGSGCGPCGWCRNAARWSARSSANRGRHDLRDRQQRVVIRTPWPTSARRAGTPWV